MCVVSVRDAVPLWAVSSCAHMLPASAMLASVGGGGADQASAILMDQERAEADDTAPLLEKATDALQISNSRIRWRALWKLARKVHDEQPAFFARGKERWNALVLYDPWRNVITWNGHPIPGSKCWKTNATPGEKGQVCLVLMVKNEAAIIERSIMSVINDFDTFVLVDTGSTDQTREIAWDVFSRNNKRGSLYEVPWYDFGTNRTITAMLAHNTGDWLLLFDADYVLEKSVENWREKLPPLTQAPSALLLGTTGDLSYQRPHLVLGSMRWCYHLRTHEFLTKSMHDSSGLNGAYQQVFPHIKINHVGDGGSKADKLPRDALLLMLEILDDARNDRPYFYLGNTLKQMRMPDQARWAYRKHSALSKWDEELFCAAEGVLQCHMMTKESNERMVVSVLHAAFTNPDRLEVMAQWLRRLRSVPGMWPGWAHVGACVGSFFTHNEFPSHQKLFIQSHENSFGFWLELSVMAFYSAPYFELGLYVSQKLMKHPEFEQQAKPVQDFTRRNRQLFEVRLRDWVEKGVRVTPAIRKHLMEHAHRLYAQTKWVRAKELYNQAMHPVVVRDAITDTALIPKDLNAEKEAVCVLTDVMNTQAWHKIWRLTTYKSGRSISPIVTDDDRDRAMCSFQLARCQERLSSRSEDRMLIVVHLIDALKWSPGYPPALASLYEMTHLATSELTRAILYMIRMASTGSAQLAAVPILRPLNDVVHALATDQSTACVIGPVRSFPQSVGNVLIKPFLASLPPRSKVPIRIKPTRPKWLQLLH